MPLNDLDYSIQCIKTWNEKGNKKFPPLSNILKTLHERPLHSYSKGSNYIWFITL